MLEGGPPHSGGCANLTALVVVGLLGMDSRAASNCLPTLLALVMTRGR